MNLVQTNDTHMQYVMIIFLSATTATCSIEFIFCISDMCEINSSTNTGMHPQFKKKGKCHHLWREGGILHKNGVYSITHNKPPGQIRACALCFLHYWAQCHQNVYMSHVLLALPPPPNASLARMSP